jgi:hypothetical protein
MLCVNDEFAKKQLEFAEPSATPRLVLLAIIFKMVVIILI